jgi:hypothetical protein
MLCDRVVFEHGSQKPYLLGVFTGLAVETLPSTPQRFDVFAALTEGLGDVKITLSVVHLETGREVYSKNIRLNFPDPLQVVNLRLQVRRLVFDVGGMYLFALLVGDEEISARRVYVYESRGTS